MGHKGIYSGLDILADEIETLFSHDSLLSRHLFTIKLYHRINIFETDLLHRAGVGKSAIRTKGYFQGSAVCYDAL
jgi:hypothetical protein